MTMTLLEPKNKENAEETDQMVLLDYNFDAIESWGWLYQSCQDYDIWTAEDCCLTVEDPPDGHESELEIIVAGRGKKSSQKISLSSIGVEAATKSVEGLLSVLTKEELDVTFKCFARQPRQEFPTIQLASANADMGNAMKFLRLQFFHINEATCRSLFRNTNSSLELRQCTINGLADVMNEEDSAPRELVISCTQPEFAKLAPGVASCKSLELQLLLHFWLEGPAMDVFCKSLELNTHLRKLEIQYLDISDDGWKNLWMVLKNQNSRLEQVKLSFTDNFVDNVRRLTPERRQLRTQVVVDALLTNHTLNDIEWPAFQQDDDLMHEVNQALERNRQK